jgi:Nucleotidyl transferase AbiEii toxin, Type IV TA system
VSSFVAEAFKRPPEVASIPCVSITRTAAEKFVASTRRTAAEIADADAPRDPTLARHIYDLHIIRSRYEVAEVAAQATFAAF